jgi:hypothetical protein
VQQKSAAAYPVGQRGLHRFKFDASEFGTTHVEGGRNFYSFIIIYLLSIINMPSRQAQPVQPSTAEQEATVEARQEAEAPEVDAAIDPEGDRQSRGQPAVAMSRCCRNLDMHCATPDAIPGPSYLPVPN